jgi:hypothetical protein
LHDSTTTEQSYWVHAMKAAVRAGRRSRPPRRRLNPKAPCFRPRPPTNDPPTAAPSSGPILTPPTRPLPHNNAPTLPPVPQHLPPPRLNQPPRGSAAEIFLTYRVNENSVAPTMYSE